MQILQTITISAPPEKIWPHVVDPQKVMAWNPKLVNVDRMSMGKESFGYRYNVTYELNGKQTPMSAEIVAFEPPTHLKVYLRAIYQADPKWWERKFYEEYTLKSDGTQTHLTQLVTIDNSGVPAIFRFLIWLIMKFGKPVGKTYLQTLKEIVEQCK